MKLSLKNDPFMYFKDNLKKEFTKLELLATFPVIFRSNLYVFLVFLNSKIQIRKDIFLVTKKKTKGKLNIIKHNDLQQIMKLLCGLS